jgi:hypothetical protein
MDYNLDIQALNLCIDNRYMVHDIQLVDQLLKDNQRNKQNIR